MHETEHRLHWRNGALQLEEVVDDILARILDLLEYGKVHEADGRG